ncbi:THUMP domain-containing protein 1 [Schistosoma japonicum]|nr:THUMP domain-containing protein 1 [Schistosoma japonicum]
MENQKSKKKRKAYYRKCAFASKKPRSDNSNNNKSSLSNSLQPGMTGYLLTYNRQERSALIETYRLLNHTLDEISSEILNSHENETNESNDAVNKVGALVASKPPTTCDENDRDRDDLYAQMLRENYPNHTSNSRSKFSFYSLKTHVSNCSFILHQTGLVSAAELCRRVFERLLSTSNAESRYVLRLMPVVTTCRSDLLSLQSCVQQAWSKFLGLSSYELTAKCSSEVEVPQNQLPTEETESSKHQVSVLHVPTQTACESTLKGPKSFMIIFKSRGFKAITRDDAIRHTTVAIKSVDPSWHICNSTPSVVVSVTVLCKVACVSILENFFKYRKYNIAEVCSPSIANNCINNTEIKRLE